MRAASIHNPSGRASRPGFSLVELLVVIAIIAVIISIVIVSLGQARRVAQSAVTRSAANAVKTGVTQFKNDFGRLPPLVKDVNVTSNTPPGRYDPGLYPGAVFTNSDPIGGGGVSVFNTSLAASNAVDRDYLRGNNGGARLRTADMANADMRFSDYSLAYYLVGALPGDVDTVDGPGMGKVTPRGGFAGGQTFGPYLATDQGGLEVVEVDRTQGRYELRDRNGTPIRFYRWIQGRPGENKKLFDDNMELTQLNIPEIIGGDNIAYLNETSDEVTRVDGPKLKGAEWGVALAGPDGVFGDVATEGEDRLRTATGATGSPIALEEAARRDNVVEVGQ